MSAKPEEKFGLMLIVALVSIIIIAAVIGATMKIHMPFDRYTIYETNSIYAGVTNQLWYQIGLSSYVEVNKYIIADVPNHRWLVAPAFWRSTTVIEKEQVAFAMLQTQPDLSNGGYDLPYKFYDLNSGELLADWDITPNGHAKFKLITTSK